MDLQKIITAGAVVSAIAALVAFWDDMGLPKIAMAADVQQKIEKLEEELAKHKEMDKKLEEEDSKQGIELYSMQLWKFLYFKPEMSDPMVQHQWNEIVEDKRRQLEFHEKRLDLIRRQ